MKKSGLLLAVVAAAVTGGGLYAWQSSKSVAAPTPVVAGPVAPAVTVAPAGRSPLVDSLVVTGTLVARNEALVGPEIEGLRIVELLAEEGDRVAAGAVLVRLSRETLDAQVAQSDAGLARAAASIAQADSQIAQAEANLALAQADLGRSQTLLKSGSATQAVVDQRTSGARAAQAQLQAARDARRAAEAERKSLEAQRRELDVRLSRTEVRSPVAGLVSRRNARLGAVASAAGEPLFRVIANGEIELDAEAPEARLSSLSAGQEAVVTLADGAAVKGRVRLVSPEVDRATRLGHVRISLENAAQARVGAFARGEIVLRRAQALSVPLSALTYDSEGVSVLVAQNGVVRRRVVTLGLVDGGRAELRDGVAEGEAVILRAGAFLRDGDAVTPVGMQAEAR
ncbi:MAG TPA: efflux RND transporter periplasmic adaptor subunit [Beijerinckiaceae bacterium]|jgi:RND family efflux transporter MFP subunit